MTAQHQRRQQVDVEIELYRHLADRLREIPLPAARQESAALERKLVQLRAERRALNVPRPPLTGCGLIRPTRV
jgi:transcription elongation GreA/GreB family factor